MNGDDYIKDEQQQQQQEVAAEQPVVADGYFSRVNGGMIQSGKYDQHIVSLIGQIISHDTIRTADGSTVQLNTEHLATEDQDDGNGNGGSSGLLVDPNEAVEIMGQVTGPTEITAFVCRHLGPEMDMDLYNQLIGMQQQSKYLQYFSAAGI